MAGNNKFSEEQVRDYVNTYGSKGYSSEQIRKALLEQGVDPAIVVRVLPVEGGVAKTQKSSNPVDKEVKIKDYVQTYRAKGYTDDAIRKALLQSGADALTVDSVMAEQKVKKKAFYKSAWFYSVLVVFLLLGLLVAGIASVVVVLDDVEEVECSFNSDCASDEECDNGECVKVDVVEDVEDGEEEEEVSEPSGGAEPQCGDGIYDIGEENCIEDYLCDEDANCEKFFGDEYECVGSYCVLKEEVVEPGVDYVINDLTYGNLSFTEVSFYVDVENVGDVTPNVSFTLLCELFDENETLADSEEVVVDPVDYGVVEEVDCVMDVSTVYASLADESDTTSVAFNAYVDYYLDQNESDEGNNYYNYSVTWDLRSFSECINDDDCNGYTCVDGSCGETCADDSGCSEGYACNANFGCELDLSTTSSCSVDSECNGYLCDGVSCSDSCVNDIDCDEVSSYGCLNSECVLVDCSVDSECGGYLCENRYCGTGCVDDSSCDTSYVCDVGLSECVGEVVPESAPYLNTVYCDDVNPCMGSNEVCVSFVCYVAECADGVDNNEDGEMDYAGACYDASEDLWVSCVSIDPAATPESCVTLCATTYNDVGDSTIGPDVDCSSALDNSELADEFAPGFAYAPEEEKGFFAKIWGGVVNFFTSLF